MFFSFRYYWIGTRIEKVQIKGQMIFTSFSSLAFPNFWPEKVNFWFTFISPVICTYIDFFQSHSYSRSGNVSLTKDNMVWTTSLWGHQFKVEFDIKVTKEVLPETWYSVFHLTKGQFISDWNFGVFKSPNLSVEPKYEQNIFVLKI